MEVTRVEQRAYIKIVVLRGRNAMECHSELVKALGNNAVLYCTVVRWVGKFQPGLVSISDKLLELERARGIEKRTVYRILSNEIHLRKIATRWVPHALTEVQRWLRYAICSDIFARWQQDGDQFLPRIIAIDQFLARAYEPELECQSMEWRHAGSRRRQEVLQNPSPVKSMFIIPV
ncbi:histone-lysine N-methyltransferase SETMAR [Trichonephila clavata]|uniref:Histone-lysine N-methyltransferase SETMAR n=1 Tax=Trichonephila clavata TaxID=2740835 RepID=A0A8X6HHC7_TRICU|nr:histone-lysine N-methyltransferase SETMAR [Trichonephila clavata]